MAMKGRVAEFTSFLGQEREAKAIAELWQRWKDAREPDMRQKRELRNYLFATSTETTTNSSLPWRNKTTLPKLCQLRDNLHANYMARLFPNGDWLTFEAHDEDAASMDKRNAMEAYITTKLDDMGFETIMSQLVLDFIDYGNAFASVEWVREAIEEDSDGTATQVYIGPKVFRISPEDIVFDVTASSFEGSPVITRSIMSMGDFEKSLRNNPGLQYDEEAVAKLRETRKQMAGRIAGDKAFARWKGLQIDGFGTLEDYFTSGFLEVLEFEGDWYDSDTGELHENVLITVVDRCHVLRRIKNPSWGGRKMKVHVGWRLRPDNLVAMGPLDNLVGMQYRIDHLENLKADALDMTLFPMLKVKGWVEDFEIGPGEKVNVGDEGDVSSVYIPNDVLSADNEIGFYMEMMEQMAGAPRDAMGFRTPGEKTKYEVQRLENAANRVFDSKVVFFEKNFVERVINLCLIQARQNFTGQEANIRAIDQSYGAQQFITIQKSDLMSRGMFKAIGARHHAEYGNFIQNLSTFMNSSLGQDAGFRAHMSNKAMVRAMEQWMGFRRFKLFGEFKGLQEQVEAQQVAQSLAPQPPPGGPEGGGVPPQ